MGGKTYDELMTKMDSLGIKPKPVKETDEELLEKIMKQQIDIKDVNIDTKKRIIEICKERLNEINNQIKEKEIKILKMKKMIEELKTLEGKHT